MSNFRDMITNVTQKLVHNEQSQLNDSNNQDDTEKKQTVKSLLTSTNINVEGKMMRQPIWQSSEIKHLNHDIILESKQITKMEDCMETTTVKLSGQEHNTNPVEIKKVKSPTTILNDWSGRVNKFRKEGDRKCKVTYVLINISGQAHRPVFTYASQVYKITAEGNGFSKKEAKQNSAAQLLTKLRTMGNKIDFSDIIKSSTTIANNNNVEMIENKSENKISTGEPGMMDNHSDKIIRKLILNSNTAKIAHCNISPISALHELVREYKLAPPIYCFQKLAPQFHKGSDRILYEVTCRVVHLLTKGVSNVKQEAKRISARIMFHKVRNLDTELLNIIYQRPTLILNEDTQNQQYVMTHKKAPVKWPTAFYFRSFFTEAVKNAYEKIDFKPFSEKPKITVYQYYEELEQYIMNNNSELTNVDKLEVICHKLGIQATYVIVHDAENVLLIKERNPNINMEYAILLQVTTVPISVNIGHGLSVEIATEMAAKNVLHLFKIMLVHSWQYITLANY